MLTLRAFLFCAIFGLTAFPPQSSAEENLRFVTWNVLAGFSPEVVKERRSDFEKAGKDLRPTILVVQEVSSHEVVAAIRDAMSLKDYHVACSTFSGHETAPDPKSPNFDPDWQFKRLEVGIISKYPFSQVIEYDPTPDNIATLGDVDELLLQHDLKLGMAKRTGDNRGFLWVKLDDPQLTISIVHLKSANGKRGEDDLGNSRQREFVMAAVAGSILQDRMYFPEYTCLVAGDFNVGHSDRAKNGVDLRRDATDPLSDTEDLYDETHALLRSGLVGGLRMKNILAHTIEPTYPGFLGSPIDNIYVTGPLEGQFQNGEITTETFSSDHRAVITELHLDQSSNP